jgi:hypothetical protein
MFLSCSYVVDADAAQRAFVQVLSRCNRHRHVEAQARVCARAAPPLSSSPPRRTTPLAPTKTSSPSRFIRSCICFYCCIQHSRQTSAADAIERARACVQQIKSSGGAPSFMRVCSIQLLRQSNPLMIASTLPLPFATATGSVRSVNRRLLCPTPLFRPHPRASSSQLRSTPSRHHEGF